MRDTSVASASTRRRTRRRRRARLRLNKQEKSPLVARASERGLFRRARACGEIVARAALRAVAAHTTLNRALFAERAQRRVRVVACFGFGRRRRRRRRGFVQEKQLLVLVLLLVHRAEQLEPWHEWKPCNTFLRRGGEREKKRITAEHGLAQNYFFCLPRKAPVYASFAPDVSKVRAMVCSTPTARRFPSFPRREFVFDSVERRSRAGPRQRRASACRSARADGGERFRPRFGRGGG